MKPGALVVFDSEKGGVGKSFISMSFIEYLMNRLKREVVVIESNAEIPDVGRRFAKMLKVEHVDIRYSGWNGFANIVEQNPGAIVVANLPSNVSGTHSDDRTGMFSYVREQMEVRVLLAWVLNNEADGILAMRREMNRSKHPISDLLVIPNLFYGRLEMFDWMRSKTRPRYIEQGVLEVVFPELWSEMAKIFREAKVPFDLMRAGQAEDGDGARFPAGIRLSLHHWIRRTDLLWDGIAHELGWEIPGLASPDGTPQPTAASDRSEDEVA